MPQSIGTATLTAQFAELEATHHIEVVNALVIDRIEMELHSDLLVGGEYPASTTVYYTDGNQDNSHAGVQYNRSSY